MLVPLAGTSRVRGVLLALLVVLGVARFCRQRDVRALASPLNLAIGAFVVWQVVSLITAVDVLYSVHEIRKSLASFVVFFLVLLTVRTRKQVDAILACLVVMAGLVSVWGIGTFLAHHGTLVNRGLRASSLMGSSQELSIYLVLIIPILLCLGFSSGDRLSRVVCLITALLSIVLLMLTHTRGAWVGVAAEIAVYAWVQRRHVFGLVAATLVVAALLGVIVVRETRELTTLERWKEVNASVLEPESLRVRLQVWEKGGQAIADHPLTGLGFGKNSFYKAYYEREGWVPRAAHLHNLFLETAVEIGVPGLLILLWLFGLIVLNAWRVWRQNRCAEAGLVSLAVILMVTGFTISGLFDHMYVAGLAQFFWLLVALQLAVSRLPGGDGLVEVRDHDGV